VEGVSPLRLAGRKAANWSDKVKYQLTRKGRPTFEDAKKRKETAGAVRKRLHRSLLLQRQGTGAGSRVRLGLSRHEEERGRKKGKGGKARWSHTEYQARSL